MSGGIAVSGFDRLSDRTDSVLRSRAMARDRTPSPLETALAHVFDDAQGAASWFTLPGGVRLFAAGDPADTLYLLRSGRLGVYKQEEGQEPHFIGVITPGEPVGEMSLIANTPHTATVVALRDSDIIALPRDAFLAAAATNPALMTELARLMILRARQTTGTVAEPTVFGFVSLSARPIAPFVALVEAEIAAGTIANNEANLTRWIHNSADVKPGSLMPPMAKSAGGALSDDEIKAVAAYLLELK